MVDDLVILAWLCGCGGIGVELLRSFCFRLGFVVLSLRLLFFVAWLCFCSIGVELLRLCCFRLACVVLCYLFR